MDDLDFLKELKQDKVKGTIELGNSVRNAANLSSPQDSPAQVSQGNIITKEMFCHTTLKIYPNGSIFFTITGKPKDFQAQPKQKQKAQAIKKAEVKSLESY
jgi:hypothetical protein